MDENSPQVFTVHTIKATCEAQVLRDMEVGGGVRDYG